jgi:hypothetical protein
MSETVSPNALESFVETKPCNPWLVHEDLSEMLAIVSAIPDGISLASFPTHSEGAECWCRPRVTFSADVMIVSHKDLSRGDFDS